MKYKKVNLGEEHRKELIRLMLGMSCVICAHIEFDMSWYAVSFKNPDDELPPSKVKNDCGTAACLLGHAPLFCKLKPDESWNWGGYADKLFGDVGPGRIHDFLFAGSWSNCHKQAVARLYLVLTKGIPEYFYHGHKYPVKFPSMIKRYAKRYGINVEDVSLLINQ